MTANLKLVHSHTCDKPAMISQTIYKLLEQGPVVTRDVINNTQNMNNRVEKNYMDKNV